MREELVSRRTLLGGLCSLPGVLQPQTKEASARRLTEEQKIQFLLTAKVGRTRSAAQGITGTLRATLSDGSLTHDASIQSIDESKMTFQTAMGMELNFRDSWKFDVAGYKLDRLLGLNMVPVSVERKHRGSSACFTWWVDDVLMLELDRIKKKLQPPDVQTWNEQMEIVRVFDQLIFNTDRNLGNLVIDKRWRIWMIDHSRAFRMSHDIREPKNLTRCDRALLAKMKELTEPQVTSAMGQYVTKSEIQAILARRDKIVKHFEEKGSGFLYDSPRRSA
jgi:hypothetical protein